MGLLACLKGMLDHIAGHGSLYHPARIHSFDVRKTAFKLNLWVALKSHTVGSKIEAGLTTSPYTVLACSYPGAPPQFPMHHPRSSTSGSIYSPGIRSSSHGVQRQLLLFPAERSIDSCATLSLPLPHKKKKPQTS